ncbi:hypothetical protein COLO4_29908 [Corchorus olitorius]|uniref:DUF4283 domain-containing protein n=1 Tax=Corchorus olitorius TaxID=93759 RepID=A0A1R3HCL6_9ROSI|nr:hypothetical protein COLO4_29908 [Corchorus olitorius]
MMASSMKYVPPCRRSNSSTLPLPSTGFKRRRESSESDLSDQENQVSGFRWFNPDNRVNYRPRAWRGPIAEAYPAEVDPARVLWRHCIIGYMLDIRVFSVRHLQGTISRRWRSPDAIRVIGRQGILYVICVENDDDRHMIIKEGPYAIEGAFFAVPFLALRLASLADDRFIPIFMEASDEEFTPPGSEDSDRPQRFRDHNLPSFPDELPPPPGRSTQLTEEHQDWMELVQRNNDFLSLLPTNNPFLPVNTDLNAPQPTLPDLETTEAFPPGSFSFEVHTSPHTGILQDIITLHNRPLPVTLEEWIQQREQIDENNPQPLNLSTTENNPPNTTTPQSNTQSFTENREPAPILTPQELPKELADVTHDAPSATMQENQIHVDNEQNLSIQTTPALVPSHSEMAHAENAQVSHTNPVSEVPIILVKSSTTSGRNSSSKDGSVKLGSKKKRSESTDSSSEKDVSSDDSMTKKVLRNQFNSLEVSDAQVPSNEQQQQNPTVDEQTLILGLRQAIPQQPPQVP